MRSCVLPSVAFQREDESATASEAPSLSGEYRVTRRVSEPADLLRGTEPLLLVDDDPGVREMTLRILKTLGYQVRVFASGPELLATTEWQTEPAELLVTDFEMPGLTGYDLASQLRAAQPSLKVLLTSGLPEENILPAVRPVDWPRFIPKPFTVHSLGRALRELLGARPEW